MDILYNKHHHHPVIFSHVKKNDLNILYVPSVLMLIFYYFLIIRPFLLSLFVGVVLKAALCAPTVINRDLSSACVGISV